MQETVTNTNESKSLFSSIMEVLEGREKKAQADKQLQEEKFLRRTQRIYELHERQRREAVELRRCLEYLTQHAHVVETALRGGGDGVGREVPLSEVIVIQAATLQRCMVQCIANASRIRQMLAATHQPQMDTMLAKMEGKLNTWTEFLHRAVDATYNSQSVIDNLQNMIAEQHRCVREVTTSSVFLSLCGTEANSEANADRDANTEAEAAAEAAEDALSPPERHAPAAACSTPIARE